MENDYRVCSTKELSSRMLIVLSKLNVKNWDDFEKITLLDIENFNIGIGGLSIRDFGRRHNHPLADDSLKDVYCINN